jgi:hypothetical protein
MGTRATVRRLSILALLLLVLPLAHTLDLGAKQSSSRRGTRPLFDPNKNPDDSTVGPFPTDLLTLEDAAQNTGRRIHLPLPDCSVQLSECQDLRVLNELDGFGLQTELVIPFDGAIDTSSVSSDSVFVVDLGGTLPSDPPATGAPVGINQAVWDVDTNTLHVEVDELLDQHRRYGLIVAGIRAEDGSHLKTNGAFRDFLEDGEPAWYRDELNAAVSAARNLGVRNSEIDVASVFTTQTTTSVLERIHEQVEASPAPSPNFAIGPDAARAAYDVSTIASITWRQNQLLSSPTTYVDSAINVNLLKAVEPGKVGRIAYGYFESPNYLAAGEYMPQVGTLYQTPPVQRYDRISFDVVLPSGTRPAGGWPVAIVGHGSGGDRHSTIAWFASTLASHGIATIAVTGFGFGSSANSKVRVGFTDGTSVEVPDYGRSVDQNGDGMASQIEGSTARQPRLWTVGERDWQRQTAIDLWELVRVIQGGVDVDGDGAADLDASKISYVGISAGSLYGTLFLMLEPAVNVAVMPSGGGVMSPTHGRWSPMRRAALGRQLAARTPSLINANGITQVDGVTVASPVYNENKPLRDQPIVINTVEGAIAIQEAFEHHEWAQQTGQSSIPYAKYLVSSPLPGVGPKALLVQTNKGDQSGVNPGISAYVRAGGLRTETMYYRHDLAYAEAVATGTVSTFPKNPHGIQIFILDANPIVRTVARALQAQMATFIASGGTQVSQPEPAAWFEVPIPGDLPETLNFIPSSVPGLP